MSAFDVAVFLGIFFAVTLAGGFVMDYFEAKKKKPGAGTPGENNEIGKINVR